MALTLTYPRRFDTSDFTVLTAAVKVLEGACTCSITASGLATGGAFSNATHRFCGFALDTAQAGQRIRLKNKGRTLLTVTGASAAKANAVVYASDDNTFTVTPVGGEVSIGRIAWVEEGEKAVVDFDASIEAGQVDTKVNAGGSVSLVGPDGPLATYNVQAHHVLREFTSLQGVTNSATGGTVTPTIEYKPELGGLAMKLAIGASVTQHDVTISGLAVPDFTSGRAKLVAEVMFEEPRAVSQIQCFAGTDTGFSTSLRCDHKLANDGIHHSHKVQLITLIPELAAANNLATTDDIATVRFRIQRSGTPITDGKHNLPGDVAASAYATNMWIRGIYIVRDTLPFVVLTFDDASTSWIDYLQPVLAARGLKGTFGVNKNDVGTNDALFINETELNTLYAYGHDIASHNLTNTAFTIAGFATYLSDFRTCRDWHYNAGRTGRLDYHPYVQGAFNHELSAALEAEGVRWARSVNDRNMERPLRNYSIMQMPSRSLGSGTSQATAQGWITQAETRQQDVVVMGHVFGPTSADSTTWAISEMETFLDFCLTEKAAGRIGGIGSLSQYLQYIGFVE